MTIIFQRYGGVGGSDADRAIANVPYRLQVAGRETSGNTGADGSVSFDVPANTTPVLELLGSRYEIHLVDQLEPLAARRGIHQRLIHLGYEMGSPHNERLASSDLAIMNFQADHPPINPDSTVEDSTRNRLRQEAGG